nr:ribonuclease H-like domain-containing protein [Tanacetum cinerariifolium]
MEHYLGHTDYPIWEVIQKGNGVSTEDANQKFLRSLLSSWSQVSLITRTKPRVDTLSFDDLYNNLRVFDSDVKGSTASSPSTHNVAFVSSDSTSSTNEVSTAYGVSTSSSYNLQREGSSSYTDDLMYSFFANQSSGLQLDYKDIKQLDEFDLEEIPKGNQESKRRDAGNTGHKARDNERRHAKQDEPKVMVTIDGDSVDWTGHAEDNTENYALMAFNSSNSGLDTEVTFCSKECEQTHAKLKKLYDEQQLIDASIEIQAYTLALKKVEAQLACHQKNQLAYEEKIRFMKLDLDDKTNVHIYHKKLLAETKKEKEELKTKLENFQNSSKGLSKLLNSQMSAKDKYGLGYGTQIHKGVLSYENEVLKRIYMPPKFDFRIDKSKFTYGLKQSKNSKFDAKTNDLASCESNSSVETLEYVPKPVESKPKVVCKPKVWSDAPIIEEYESKSDDEYVFKATVEQEIPSCAFINTVKHVKSPRQTIKDQDTPFNKTTTLKANFANTKVNAARDKTVSADGGYKETVVKASADCNWRSKRHYWNKVSKYNRKGIVDSGCSRHMTGNKAYLVEYQDFNGGPVAFEGSKGQITEFKNKYIIEFCASKGIKREFSNARTSQQNRVAERKNRALIKAARTMLVDLFLPNTFWAEAVSTACYVLNRVLVTNPQNKTPYELITGFIDPKFPKKAYKVVKTLYGLHQAPRAWYVNLSTFLVKSGHKRGFIDKTLFIKKDKKDIMLTASTPIETKKPLDKDAKVADVDVHLYRSMIGSLMYLTASRPDIMYVVCACSRFQVTPKTSHLHAVKSIFRRFISWQCKKQTIVATSTTEAEYVAAANCCGFNFLIVNIEMLNQQLH